MIHVTLGKLIHFSEPIILEDFPHLFYIVVVRTSKIVWYAESPPSPKRSMSKSLEPVTILWHGKGEIRLLMELRLLTSWPWDGEMILTYSGGPNDITRVLTSGGGRQKREPERFQCEKVSAQNFSLWRWRTRAISQEMWAACRSQKR